MPVLVAVENTAPGGRWADVLALLLALIALLGEGWRTSSLPIPRSRRTPTSLQVRPVALLPSSNYFFSGCIGGPMWPLPGRLELVASLRACGHVCFLRYLTGIPHAERSSLKHRGLPTVTTNKHQCVFSMDTTTTPVLTPASGTAPQPDGPYFCVSCGVLRSAACSCACPAARRFKSVIRRRIPNGWRFATARSHAGVGRRQCGVGKPTWRACGPLTPSAVLKVFAANQVHLGQANRGFRPCASC